jgi:hypothetical protein
VRELRQGEGGDPDDRRGFGAIAGLSRDVAYLEWATGRGLMIAVDENTIRQDITQWSGLVLTGAWVALASVALHAQPQLGRWGCR